ncbi:P-loop containing nucleoside triphosphate hydrolase protein [Leucosporidium creatinivorum]|uniref:p-loop containing nucleoside triphosphate hydrolase protein n=1 Tax=Leucosporidium creatinivorum TaxID=106004 RepID=A0A1Y2FPV7_9BASI|nr:P-loop containing nucleoside triphosphate hydrolase protein [Leucosporidium creatinivorum]
MAFGSATLPVRTKIKVTTKATVKTTTTSSSVASTSELPAKGRKLADDSSQSQPPPKRRESLPDPTDSEDDDDPDFGRSAKEKTREEAEDLMQKEAVKRAKEAEKIKKAECRKQGIEYVPPPKVKKARKSRVKDESDDEPLPVVRRPPPRTTASLRARAGDSTDSDEDKNVTKSRYDPEARKRELAQRTGYNIGGLGGRDKGKGKAKEKDLDESTTSDEFEGEGYLKKRHSYAGSGKNRRRIYPDTERGRAQEIKSHLKRRWVNKKHPERMSAYRKRMEELHNPLVQLLNVEITVVNSDNESMYDGSDDNNHSFNLRTDSEDDEKPPVARQAPPRPKKPLATPMLDHVDRKVKRESSSEDVKPLNKEEEDVKPFIKREEEDVKPVITPMLTLSDDESEPATEPDNDDDESPSDRLAHRLSLVDVKPVIHPSPPPVASTSKLPDTAQDVNMLSLVDDSGSEPPTEDEGPILPLPPSNIKKEADPTPMISLSDSEPEPETEVEVEDDGSDAMDLDEDEEMDPTTKMLLDDRRKQLEKKREAEKKRIRREDEERIRRKMEEASKGGDSDCEDDNLVTELSHSQAIEQAASQVASQAIPKEGKPVLKGRPKFPIFTQEQLTTGRHRLSSEHEIPTPINRFLRPYQRDGVDFLHHQFSKGMGGVLGDDMGLGKTIQVIAFLSAVMNKTGRRQDGGARSGAIRQIPSGEPLPAPSEHGLTCLIICPASVVHNWEREFQVWSYIDTVVYGGNDKKDRLRMFSMGHKDVVIAGFETARKNIDRLSREDFSIVIVDEAHRLKSHKAEVTQAIHRFDTRLRYGLTGTAVQNRLGELWSILNWAVPTQVGTAKQWGDLVTSPLKFTQKSDATDEQLALGRRRTIALAGSLLPRFWIRRTKESVKLQLPRKIDNIVLCPLTDTQKEVYRNIMQLDDVQILLTADDPCPCGSMDDSGVRYKQGKCCQQDWSKMIFKYMDLFRKISNHLALIYPDKEDKKTNPAKYQQDLAWVQAAFPDDWQNRKLGAVQNDYDPELCGKWKILCDLLDVWKAAGDKVLLFTNTLKILDLLEKRFEAKQYYKWSRLDGKVANDDRMALVDEFNDPKGGVDVFLISTRAGGVGLNLTAANRVVIFDPNWNPSHDLQAMDRSYRFGQTREVHVYRLVGAGTIEELIINRQQVKRALANMAYDANAERRLYTGVEGEKEHTGELYGVKNIFKYTEHFSLTEKAIKDCALAEAEYEDPEDEENADGSQRIKEIDENEVVKGLVDIGQQQHLTAAERRKKEEQEAIKRILTGAYTLESNATLGNSKAEEERARRAVQGQTLGSKPRAREDSPATKRDSKAADVKPAPKAPKSTAAWDPTARRGKKRKAPETGALPPKPKREVKVKSEQDVKVEVKREEVRIKPEPISPPRQASTSASTAASLSEAVAMLTEIKKRLGISSSVTFKQIVEASYPNRRDFTDWLDELVFMDEAGQKRALERLCLAYKNRRRA